MGKEHAGQLISVLEQHYTVVKDWSDKWYDGITLDWDYARRKVHLSMPCFCKEALLRFKHIIVKLRHQPHKHTVPTEGATPQYTKEDDTYALLSNKKKTFVQQVTGTFSCYTRAMYSTMLVALSVLVSKQATPTQETMEKVTLFLDYGATHPDAVLTFKKNNMVLAIYSDTSYLAEPKARRQAGGHFFMSDNSSKPENNGAITDIAQMMKHVVSSAADAEIGALFINTRQAIPARMVAEEPGHPQSQTPVQTDNTIALRFANKNLQPKVTKSTNMKTGGSETERHRINSDFTGHQGLPTMLIILQSIYVKPITERRDPGSSHRKKL